MPLQDTHSSGFLNQLQFLEEDKQIRKLLYGGVKNIFKGLTLGALQSSDERKETQNFIDILSEDFSDKISSGNLILPAMQIAPHIKDIVLKVNKILTESGDLSVQGINKIKKKIQLRAFTFWVLCLLKSCGFDTSDDKNIKDVPSKYSMVLYDILKDKGLATLLIVLKSYGFVDLSKNQINDYEVEEEVKVLNIDRDKTIRRLEELGAQKVFEGEVHDVYYDYPDEYESLEKKGGIKSTFRIRKKTDREGNIKFYYTVKRKITEVEEEELIKTGVLQQQTGTKTKRAYEKEFEVTDISLFEKIIAGYGLVKSREKKKKRVSYSLERGNIKFDFDDYAGKQSLMEIEASKYRYVDEYIHKLGLQNHETSISGSRKFINNPNTDIR